MNFEEEAFWQDHTYSPKGKQTDKKLKELGIESPKGNMIKVNNRTWKITSEKKS